MTLTPGTRIGPYEILSPIGAGGMGEVYKATDTRLQRIVAIKFLPPELTRDKSAKARFTQEARAASSLDHPNICTIHQIDETPDGQLFIVMSYYEGETLKERIASGPLPIDEAVDLARQVAGGLSKAHASGIVHRDIKPANVIITRDHVAKILDFGLAKLPEVTMTQTGMLWGTVAYMSPEQASGATIDARTDLWALGVVLYEMLTGRPPFQGDASFAVMYQILNTAPQSVTESRSEVPAELGRVVEHALTKRAEDRYSSAEWMLADLTAFSEQTKSRSKASTGSGAHRVPSIAVLPFTDMSPQRDQDYFCEGMAEELINALSGLKEVRVASRTSAFQFKGQTPEPSEIGTRLKVGTILEGSVRKAGNRLRITVQLINAPDGYQIWSQRYDRDMDDVFAVQDEIALAVVEKLKVQLGGVDEADLVKRPTDDLEAYSLYLQGRYFWTRRMGGFMQQAIDCFEQAVARDPSFALAYAGLADAHTILHVYGLGSADVCVPKAGAAAERAMALDPTSAETLMAMALHLWGERKFDESERYYRRALELHPNAALARAQLGVMLASLKRFEEAIPLVAQARVEEPVSLLIGYYAICTYVFARQYERALDDCRVMLALDQNFPMVNFTASTALSGLGRHEESIAAARRAVEASNRLPLLLGELGATYAAAGRRDEAREVLDELRDRPQAGRAEPLAVAEVLAGLGERDSAFERLERAREEGSWFLNNLAANPRWDPIRDDPRFTVLLKQLGLPTE